MSKYTTELRYICEQYAGLDESEGYMSVKQIVETARPKIFDFDYPIFDESYKSVLETKIIRHFYTREIGCESVGLWKMWLDNKMNEIMPYYNQLYNSELIKFNPLYDTDLTTDRNDKFNSNRVDDNNKDVTNGGRDITDRNDLTNITNSGRDIDTKVHGHVVDEKYDDRDSSDDDRYTKSWHNEKTEDWHYEADTPQSTIAGINDSNYATRAVKDTHSQANGAENAYNDDKPSTHDNFDYVNDRVEHNNHNTTLTTNSGTDTDTKQFGKVTDKELTAQKVENFGHTVNDKVDNVRNFASIDDWLEHMVGKRSSKSYSQLLNEFRSTFLNIDMDIIRECEDLFFGLW